MRAGAGTGAGMRYLCAKANRKGLVRATPSHKLAATIFAGQGQTLAPSDRKVRVVARSPLCRSCSRFKFGSGGLGGGSRLSNNLSPVHRFGPRRCWSPCFFTTRQVEAHPTRRHSASACMGVLLSCGVWACARSLLTHERARGCEEVACAGAARCGASRAKGWAVAGRGLGAPT